jgi:uncharacterized membrane protein YgcG
MKLPSSIPILLVLALLGAVTIARAQEQEQPYPPTEQQSQAQPEPKQVWTADQLDNIVAPIALYPDPLLGQILVASTYPLEVVEASQWLKRNRNLRGQELVDAAKRQPWDPSIQALVAVPDALAKLNEDIRWTTDLGNAFLSQQADVMSAVQRMRARAQDNGRLSSTPQQTVTAQEQGGQQVIIIQPADPQVIYVPAYDPVYIWGPPVYGYYPPLYYPAFHFGFGIGFNLGFCFDSWLGWDVWGWGPSWFGHSVFVNNYFFHRHGFHQRYGGDFGGRTPWVHDPGHRMHIPYGNSQAAARFGGRSMGSRNSFRSGGGEPRGAASSYANRSEGRFAGRTGAQGYRNTSPQAQRYQNPERQRYQPSQQYRSSSQQYRTAPQTQRYQSQSRYQPSQQYRSSSQQYRTAPQTQRYQSQSQRYQPSQQYRAAPQVQRFQSQSQLRYQAPQQYRAAPQMSAQRFSGGGNFSRGSGSFSRGSGGGLSQGGGGNFSRGSGGGFSRGGGGSRHR